MGVTGFWYVRQASDDEIARVRPGIDLFVQRVKADANVQKFFESWHNWPERIHGYDEDHELNRPSELFLRLFISGHPGEDAFFACSRDDLDPVTWELGRDGPPDETHAGFAWMDRFPPMLLLFAALGPERSAWLPGALGCFALSSQELADEAAHIRHAHAMSPAERADAVARMQHWIQGAGAPGFDTHHVLEALPDVVGPAVSAGMGLVSVTTAV